MSCHESTLLTICKEDFAESSSHSLFSDTPIESLNNIRGNNVSIVPQNLVEVKIGPKHFDLLKLIGEGAFGKVLLVRNKLNECLYAMKVISKKYLKKKNNIQYMKSERDILLKMKHPFIVTLWHAFQTEKKLFLVMDFLAGGELFFHLKRRGLILEQEVRFYLAEIILALEFLHDLGIIHRDLKPENVLLRYDGHIALTDFGLAKDLGTRDTVKTFCGTSEYMVIV
jgi:serine/threonine protein kinase